MGQNNTRPINPLRANDWWMSKASLLMGFVYLYTLWFHISLERFIPLAVLSIIVISGFASFGYLINDYYDMDQDRIAGKRNSLLDRSPSYRITLMLVSLTLITIPWIWLPAGTLSYMLIGIQLVLFFLYSAPPVRLKEKGIAGVIADALYAHALPVMLAAYTFALASDIAISYGLLSLLFLWQLLCGMRNILIHQLEDIPRDELSATRTLMASTAPHRSLAVIKTILIAEISVCTLFFSGLSIIIVGLTIYLVILLIPALISIYRYLHTRDRMPEPPLRYFPNGVYERRLPLVYLILLSFGNGYFLIILVLHILLFGLRYYANTSREAILPTFYLTQRSIIIPLRRILSAVTNNAIYHILLLFHIDLKKEQLSLLGYFRKKCKDHK